jgi:hypothetical protein
MAIRILIKGLYLERKPPAGNAHKHVLTKAEFLIGILVATGVTEDEPLICIHTAVGVARLPRAGNVFISQN